MLRISIKVIEALQVFSAVSRLRFIDVRARVDVILEHRVASFLNERALKTTRSLFWHRAGPLIPLGSNVLHALLLRHTKNLFCIELSVFSTVRLHTDVIISYKNTIRIIQGESST